MGEGKVGKEWEGRRGKKERKEGEERRKEDKTVYHILFENTCIPHWYM